MQIGQNGTWVNLEPELGAEGAQIRVRSAFNSDYETALATERARIIAEAGIVGEDDKPAKLTPQQEEAAQAAARPGNLFTGWRNFKDENGEPLPDHVAGPMTDAEKQLAREIWRIDAVAIAGPQVAYALTARYQKFGRDLLGKSSAVSTGSASTDGT